MEETIELDRARVEEMLAEVKVEVQTAFRITLDILQDEVDYEEGAENIVPHLRNVLHFIAAVFEPTGLVDDWDIDGTDLAESSVPDGAITNGV